MTPDVLDPIQAQLHAAYTEYVGTVSSPGMACSLETASVLAWLCAERKPARVCDLGSGFSSYALRRSCTDVTSVDTEDTWLAATRRFLDEWGLPTWQMVPYHKWCEGTDMYDLIFHDLAQGDLREMAMWPAVERLAPGGMIVFDDAHHDSHNETMHAVIAHHGLTLVEMRDATLDGINRYALGAVKET